MSDSARADLDRMLEASVRAAQQRLTQASEFDPFALVIDPEGRLLAVDLDLSGLGKHPDAATIAKAITAQLGTLATSVRCTALTLNTRLSREKTDAVEVRLEHREHAALLVLLPYKRPRFGGQIDYGQLRAFPGEREVWVDTIDPHS